MMSSEIDKFRSDSLRQFSQPEPKNNGETNVDTGNQQPPCSIAIVNRVILFCPEQKTLVTNCRN